MKTDIELIYIHEGLCGWTFAFNHSLLSVLNELSEKVNLQLISTEIDLSVNKSYLDSMRSMCDMYSKKAIPNLKLGEPFIQKVKTEYFSNCNSLALSKAMIAIQKYYPSRTLESLIFFQNKLFLEGKNISDSSSYLGWFYELGMDGEYLFYYMNGNMTEDKRRLNQEFLLNLGITSYPVLLLQNKNRLRLIAKGYMPPEQLLQSINTVLSSVEV